jgi:hypothetical protein
MNNIVHTAGKVVCYQGRFIQRCAICGLKMIDTQGQELAPSEGQVVSVIHWPEGQFVEEENGKFEAYEMEAWGYSRGRWPENCCITLVE